MAKIQEQTSLSREQVIAILQRLEENYPVETWYVDDIPVWPLVKIKLFFEWFRTYKKQFSEASAGGSSPKETGNGVAKLAKVAQGAAKFAALMVAPVKPSAFLFTGAAVHRTDFEGKFRNKFFDPVMEHIADEAGEDAISVDYNVIASGKKYTDSYPLLFLAAFSPFLKSLQWSKRKTIHAAMKRIDVTAFAEEIQRELGSKLSAKKFSQVIGDDIFSIEVFAFFYAKLFRKYKTKYALGLWYYHLSVYGMNLAAFRNGVVSVDVQHGSQGPTHVAYANFNKVPANGYSILPKVFWCWEQGSADVVTAWAGRSNYHSAVVGGNPWLDFLRERSSDLAWLPATKRIVLYTLQHTFLEPYILEAIAQTGDRFFWLLRLHPRELHNKGKLEAALQERGLTTFADIENATKIPLPLLMPNCSVHLSKYSGSIIEAALLDIPNVILDDLGVQNYRDLIEEGQAIACTDMSADSLVLAIDNSISRPSMQHSDKQGAKRPNYKSIISAWIAGIKQ